ncbi:MAG TPA: hypothetical protein VGJ78_24240 [Vicinamibacterales bacterium]
MAYHVFALLLPDAHALCIAVQWFLPHDGSWDWFSVFIVDLPFSLLLVRLTGLVPPFLLFGVLGTAWWVVIGRVFAYAGWRLVGVAFRRC